MLESFPVSLNLFHFHRISSISFIFYFDNFLLRFYNLSIRRDIHLFILYVYVSFKHWRQCSQLHCVFYFGFLLQFTQICPKSQYGFYSLNVLMLFKYLLQFHLPFLYLYSLSNCLKRLPFNTSIQCFSSIFNAYFPFPVSFQYNCFINKLFLFVFSHQSLCISTLTSVYQYNSIENKNSIMLKWFLVHKFENFVIFYMISKFEI